MPWTALGLWCVLAGLVQLIAPATAYAWWGKLEKLSGPSGLNGPQFDFRVACFGDVPKGAALAREAAELSARAVGTERSSALWKAASERWVAAAEAWADYLQTTFDSAAVSKAFGTTTEYETLSNDFRTKVEELAREAAPVLMATSSAGVVWSFCKPEKERRFAIDAGWGNWSNNGSPEYASGEPLTLNTVTAALSWRVFSNPRWDVLQASAGAGMYWFTSKGIPGHRGFVVQPGRLTFRGPSVWSKRAAKGWQRLLALPVYGIGLTTFPSGFEATDFAGVGAAAVRIPSELVVTHYVFLNWQPLLYAMGK